MPDPRLLTEEELAAMGKRVQGWKPLIEWGPVCAGCGDNEYRIDGYCSIDCRDYHGDDDVASLLAHIAAVTEQRDEAVKERDALAGAARERDWLRRGMKLARKRHLHNAHRAAEDLTAWTLNDNDPDEWQPTDFGKSDEADFRRRVKLNRDIGADSSEPLDYLPALALSRLGAGGEEG